MDYPYTIHYCIKKSLQIESFFELPKDKQPPKSIWDDNEELEEWFDAVLQNKNVASNVMINADDIE